MLKVYHGTARVGQGVYLGIAGFGRFMAFSALAFNWLVSRPSGWCRWRLLRPQLYAVGVASIPVVAITGGFIGMILAL